MPSPTGWSSVARVALTGNPYVDGLISGYRWTGSVTYSFPGYDSYWSQASGTGYGPSPGNREPWSFYFSPLSSSDRPYFGAAIQKWAAVSNLQVVVVADAVNSVGDIRAAYTLGAGDHTAAAAWAYFPDFSSSAGDIWFNAAGTSATDVWTSGSFANFTVLHELGHAMGLKHPFSGSALLPGQYDSQIYTVMSYSALPGQPNMTLSYYPTSPMLYDISAMQYLYGANYNFQPGNDIYAFGDTQTYNETLWDGGGTDALRYDGRLTSSIDLREGSGSTIGQRVYAESGLFSRSVINNVWIAFGAKIENAIGGFSADIITGNDLRNTLQGREGDDTLYGNGGNDVLDGGAGNDVLDGGSGIDQAYFSGRRSDFTLTKVSSGFTARSATEGTDSLIGIERIRFADKNIALDLVGNAGTTAKIIGVVFGSSSVYNASYVGIGLASLDSGMSNSDLMQLALNARLGVGFSPSQQVSLIYANLFGVSPTPAELAYWTQTITSGQFTRATFGLMAAETTYNASNIGLTGLATAGIEYA